jgi:DNA polymerase-4
MRTVLDDMARENARWLDRNELLCRTVTIKVRYSDFTTLTRSDTRLATRDADDLAARAVALLDRTEADRRPVRLLGVSVHNLVAEAEPAPLPALPFAE